MSPETYSIIATLAVLFFTIIFFIIGKIRSDIVALSALLSLTLLGVLTPEEAFSGFSNTVIASIAGVFVVGGAIVRSGLANTIGAKILKLGGSNQNVLFILLMLLTVAVGALVSNTGTVAIMMPIVVSVAISLDESPSRFLMPLAFMSSIGGMMTLIGNPGNLVVNDVYISAGYKSLTLFSFLPIGMLCLVFGIFVLLPATSYYLSCRKNEKRKLSTNTVSLKDLADKYKLSQNLYKLVVPQSSPLINKNLADLKLTVNYGVLIQEIRRPQINKHFRQTRHKQISPEPKTTIEAGDILYCIAPLEKLKSMAEKYSLEIVKEKNTGKEQYHFDSIGICELVLMSSSNLIDQSVADGGLRRQFGITLLGIQRGSQYMLENLKDQVLQSGDCLLVQGSWENLTKLDAYSENWVLVGRPDEMTESNKAQKKMPIVAFVLLCMILSMATGLLPTVMAVMLAALALVLAGCYRNVSEAYSAINWETLVMIACMLPMAIAMEKSGLVNMAAKNIISLGNLHGPLAALAMVYAVTSGMNIVISATPVALLVAPVALQVALALQVDPLPFVYGVATASCMCFASPFSTPANALVMSAGRYTFIDYLKIGLPLQFVMGIFVVLSLPFLFPF